MSERIQRPHSTVDPSFETDEPSTSPLAPPRPAAPPRTARRAASIDAAPTPVRLDWIVRQAIGKGPVRPVLVHAPSASFQAPGGGEVQLIQTVAALEARGWPMRPFNPWSDRIEKAWLLHLFGMSREGLALARIARAKKVPVVISPICWSDPRAIRALESNPIQRMLALGAWAAHRYGPMRFGWRAELLALASAILPNSRAEAAQLMRLYGARRDKIRVVPNGVEARFAHAEPNAFRHRFDCEGQDGFVLYVGRIEPRKNVLGLIRALSGGTYKLVVIGDAVPGQERYAGACRLAGKAFVRWIPRIEHDDPLLASAYAAARVLALPSWFETPGLVALEAALAGSAGLVLTPYGSTREVFGPQAHYARPDRPAEIRQAVAAAWEQGPPANLARHVAEHHLWPEVGRLTAEAYDRVAR
jgi:glycosyltransferase involved in cell wall biosynthesis